MNQPRWLRASNVTRPEGVAANAIVRMLRVPPEAHGMRLDVFLSESLRNTSRTRAKLIAENSAYTPDGRNLKPSERLQGEQHIVLWRPAVDDEDPGVELEMIYEDEYLLVINKPPHLTVHPTARHYHNTVIKVLEQRRPGQFFSLVHRLDKETSGVLMVALSQEADRAFKMLLEDRSLSTVQATGREAPSIDKIYLAIVRGQLDPRGELPSDDSSTPTLTLDAPLEPDSSNALRVKMRVAKAHSPTALPARTLATPVACRNGYSLVECRLLTGRQHQIRVHLAAAGCPVVGDKLYGPDDRLLARAADGELTEDDLALLELSRHALHAWRYRLPHAITGQLLDLVAPVSEDLGEFWAHKTGTALCDVL